MKSLIVLGGAIALSVGLAASGTQTGTATVNGYLMDVMCATEHASEGPAAAAKHDKSCLLMDPCVKSGYSVIAADNKVLRFDAKGNELALALINATEKASDWKIAVTGTVSGDSIAVASVKLQ